MEFTDASVSTWAPKREFSFSQAPINSVDFDDTGEKLLTANQNNALEIYDAVEGRHLATIKSETYGCDLARWVHGRPHFVHSVGNGPQRVPDFNLRLVDYTKNSYLTYFKGHNAMVDSMIINPINNTLLSSGRDGSLFVWDVNNGSAVAEMESGAKSLLSTIDSTGLVFAAASNSKQMIAMYDMRTFKPFLRFPCKVPGAWLQIEFSNDNKYLLVVSSKAMVLYDSFTGDFVTTLKCEIADSKMPATFSTDGSYVFAAGGANDHSISVFNLKKKLSAETRPWQTWGSDDVAALAFSPSAMTLVGASHVVRFWCPS